MPTPHVARRVQYQLNAMLWDVLEHPTNSLDLLPWGFQIFGPLHKAPSFTSDDVVQRFRRLKEFFADGVRQLAPQRGFHLKACGNFLWLLPIPSPVTILEWVPLDLTHKKPSVCVYLNIDHKAHGYEKSTLSYVWQETEQLATGCAERGSITDGGKKFFFSETVQIGFGSQRTSHAVPTGAPSGG